MSLNFGQRNVFFYTLLPNMLAQGTVAFAGEEKVVAGRYLYIYVQRKMRLMRRRWARVCCRSVSVSTLPISSCSVPKIPPRTRQRRRVRVSSSLSLLKFGVLERAGAFLCDHSRPWVGLIISLDSLFPPIVVPPGPVSVKNLEPGATSTVLSFNPLRTTE